MTDLDTDAALVRLLADCEEAMIDPCPEMAHWGPYCRLIDFKLATAVSDQQRHLIDAVLMRMRGQLAPFARSQLAHWRLLRLGDEAPPRLSPTEPLAHDLADYLGRRDDAGVRYHGTVRGLLPPIYLRGLRPEFRTDWRQQAQAPVPMLVDRWREAEVHAVVAHLRGPTRRALAYWQPAVLRIPMPPAPSGEAWHCGDDALVAGTLPVGGAEVWLIGEDPRPHWQPLIAVLSRRRPSPQPRPPVPFPAGANGSSIKAAVRRRAAPRRGPQRQPGL